MKPVIIQFMQNIKSNDQEACQADSQAGDIQNKVSTVFPHIADRVNKKTFKHKLDL